ncbi:MAG: enoyl-CoA hydratase/isomerase family protein [Gemmataceae bacterium]
MLYESAHLRVETADGVATLWLGFPGSPVNALSPVRLAELGRTVDAVERCPGLDLLVVRSALPGGFCGGFTADALDGLTSDPARFSRFGQSVLDRLASLPIATVAYVEGSCLGPGLELALACDHRLAVAGPDSWVGFPLAEHGLPPCWGGVARLPQRACRLLTGRLITAREAVQTGVFADACSARRGRIELHSLTDRLLAKANVRPRPHRLAERLARERIAFRQAADRFDRRTCLPATDGDWESVPAAVGFVGSGWKVAAVELALRGGRAVLLGSTQPTQGVDRLLADAVRWGRATPLEADQTRKRVEFADHPNGLSEVEWVVAAQRPGFPVRPGRLLIASPAMPEPGAGNWRQRVGVVAQPAVAATALRVAA